MVSAMAEVSAVSPLARLALSSPCSTSLAAVPLSPSRVLRISALAAPAFAAAATRAHIDYSFYVGENLLHVSQVTVDESSPLANREIEDVERAYDLTIVMHQTADEIRMHPHSDDMIHVGDTLVVFASLETLGQLGLTNHQRVSGAKIRQPNQSAIRRIFNRSRTSSRSAVPRDAKTHRAE